MGRPLVAGQVDGVAIAIAERGQHIEAKITPLLEAGQATHARDSCMLTVYASCMNVCGLPPEWKMINLVAA